MEAKADLHVHSKYSDRPSEWLLRRIGAPECFVEPEDIYRQARRNGMTYVTIADHNCIAGALDIAHLPGTFLSAEITTYFPEDGCKIHVVVSGISEAEFRDIDSVRESIYDLRAYLHDKHIMHTVAHPLFAVNERLTIKHVEKLLVLFKRFETLNGTRHYHANRLFDVLLDALTPRLLDDLANQHDLAPEGEQPWIKYRTGGSDDHSGAYAASAYTVVPEAETLAVFLDHLRQGRHAPGGTSGTSLQLAHSFYRIGYSYYRERLMNTGKGSMLFTALLQRMSGELQPKPHIGPVRALARRILTPWKRRRLSHAECALVDEFSALFSQLTPEEDEPTAVDPPRSDHTTFRLASNISQQIGYHFFTTFLQHLNSVSLLESLQTFVSLAPVAVSVAPYVAAFKTQHKDDGILRDTARRFDLAKADRPMVNKAWVTDTFSDVNGVARTIRTLSALARRKGRSVTVVTCLQDDPREAGLSVHNFKPVGMFQVPEYTQQELAFPPFLELLEYFERERFTEIVISTPGPLGLAALAAAKLLGLGTTGIYHTDFPKYVELLTEDQTMAQVTWRLMGWFYGQMDRIYAPSEWYKRSLQENGLGHKPIVVLPRGVDTEAFTPDKRRAAFWTTYGCNGNFKFLYVGRISKEKNIQVLVNAFDRLVRQGHRADLVLVGDGPLMPRLRKQFSNRRDVVLTGFLEGETLQCSYASADAFVFPSTTDTFGNVVLEAQAAGLPAIVANAGGPPEIVQRHDSGLIVNGNDPDALCEAMARLLTDTDLRNRLRQRALLNARERTWENILNIFWTGKAATSAVHNA